MSARSLRGAGLVVCLLGCRASTPPAPVPAPPAQIPAGLVPSPPEVRHIQTEQGLNVAVHDLSPDEALCSITLHLPRGSVHQPAQHPAVAWLASMAWTHATSAAFPQEDWAADMFTFWGGELTVEPLPEFTVFNGVGPAVLAASLLERVCDLAFHPLLDGDTWQEVTTQQALLLERRTWANAGLADDVVAAFSTQGPLGASTLPADEPVDTRAVAAWMTQAAQTQGALLVAAVPPGLDLQHALSRCGPSAPVAPTPVQPRRRALPSVRPSRVAIFTQDEHTAFVRVGGPAPPAGTPAALLLDVALQSVANGFSSAAVTELRTRRGLVYGVDAALWGTRADGLFSVGTSVKPAHALAVAAALEAHLQTLFDRGLTAEAWQRLARASALSAAAGTESVENRMALLGDAFMVGQPPAWAWSSSQRLWNLQPGEDWSAARRGLDKTQRVTVVVGPRSLWNGAAPADLVVDVKDWRVRVGQ